MTCYYSLKLLRNRISLLVIAIAVLSAIMQKRDVGGAGCLDFVAKDICHVILTLSCCLYHGREPVHCRARRRYRRIPCA